MGKAGRPSVMTPEAVEKLLQALRAGNFRNVAAEWAGISQRVFREWMAKGKDEKAGSFRDFRRRVLEAEKAAEIRAVGLLMKAAEHDAKHASWWLERKFPERWGRKERHEVSGAKGGPIQTESALSGLSAAELKEMLAALRKGG